MDHTTLHTDDNALVLHLQQGDIRSFNQFFKEFYNPLFYYSRHLVQDEEEAKDIVLDAFYKCWERREQFETYQHVKSFLYLVVRNAGLNYLKRKDRATHQMHHYLLSLDTVEQAEDYLATEAEVLKKVHRAIEQLPDKCRHIFELSYIEGKSVTEIAELLQISAANVSSQRHRAIQLLRIHLADSPLVLAWFLMTLLEL